MAMRLAALAKKGPPKGEQVVDDGVESLGAIRNSFRPKMGNIVAGFIIGMLLVFGGIGAALWMSQLDDPTPSTEDTVAQYLMMAVLGIGGPFGGAALLLYMKRLMAHRVTVFDDGFSYLYRGKKDFCRWDATLKIEEVLTQEQIQIIKVPGTAIKRLDRSFVVHRNDGKTFDFTVNSINDVPALGDLLTDAAERHQIAWEQKQVK